MLGQYCRRRVLVCHLGEMLLCAGSCGVPEYVIHPVRLKVFPSSKTVPWSSFYSVVSTSLYATLASQFVLIAPRGRELRRGHGSLPSNAIFSERSHPNRSAPIMTKFR